MNPAVSVVIPIYKSENYLKECLNSLFIQTLSDIEYIFVDDCSPDKSVDLIYKFLKNFPKRKNQVKVIHHERNRGVAVSRQDGLELATGEYIIHCDSDDWIEYNFLEELYNTAKRDNADVVFCDFQYDSGYYSKRINQRPTMLTSQCVLCELFGRLHGSSCNKLIKKSKINSLGIEFDPKFNFCEDLLFNTKLFLHPLSISYSSKALYHYRSVNTNSVVRTYNLDSFKIDKQLAAELISLVQDTSAKDSCSYKTAYLISWRAFIGNCFTSKEYRQNIGPLLRKVICAKISNLQKVTLILASLGLYKSVYSLYTLYKNKRFCKL